YILMNPVRVGIVNRPEQYRWSSCKAHLRGEDDILVKVRPLGEIISNWKDILTEDHSNETYKAIRSHEKTGRPLGNIEFLERLEKQTSRLLKKQKPGPKKR
ncbi:MAG: transposase, partial [Deltaproteobacteria bacterium]|nr:transposase [Deltaproteobacteria bacterium]